MQQCSIIYRIINQLLTFIYIYFTNSLICLISACDKGYNGHNCEVICPLPSYGQDCQSICSSTETSCDPVDGCIGYVTEIGIIWNNIFVRIYNAYCNQDYIYLHLFLPNIEIFLICLISACDKGYNGHNCEAICHFPSYGQDCQSICNCTETSCDPVDGCSGYITEIGIIWNIFWSNLQCVLQSRFIIFR